MTDDERTAAEMRGLLGFARGFGLVEATVREIYEAVGREAAAAGVDDDDRMDEVRKRMLVAWGTSTTAIDCSCSVNERRGER